MGSASESLSYNQQHSKDSVDNVQRQYLQDMFYRAQQASNQNTVAGFTPLQEQAQGMAANYAGSLTPFTQNALGGANFLASGAVLNPNANPHLQQTAAAAMRPVFENLTQNVLPGIRGDAAMTGNVGGSRQGIAEGLAAQGALRTAGDIGANIYSQGYGQGLGAMTQGLGLAPQTAQLGLMPADILNQVGGAQQALQQQILNMPLSNLSQLAQIIGSPIVTNESRGYGWGQGSSGSFLSGG